MPARKTSTRRPRAKRCPDCAGRGETTEVVRVGSRRKRETADRQTAMCLTCWGSGTTTD